MLVDAQPRIEFRLAVESVLVPKFLKAPGAATSRAFWRARQSLLVSGKFQVVSNDGKSPSIIPALEIKGLVVRAVDMDDLAWT
jgi:hypothetical protein